MTTPLVREIQRCTFCAPVLPHSPRPVLSFSEHSKIIIIGQAPGIRVHQSGIPWNDPSGERLRQWLNVGPKEFYDNNNFGIVPMGFCYPGTGKSGDLPPRPECAENWMGPVLDSLSERKLILLIGQYSQKYFLQDSVKSNLTTTVKSWQEYLPDFFVLPHPSPRNNIWLKKNPWFEKSLLKSLQREVQTILS